MNPQNIYITGFSGTGKTTVGQLVAENLGWKFVDVDEQIVAFANKTIEDIFAKEGEKAFRTIETELLTRISKDRHQVISTGGGIVLAKGNRTIMENTGTIVCLEAQQETIHYRLVKEYEAENGSVMRPMLKGDDFSKGIKKLKWNRQPYYSQAHWTVNTDLLTPHAVALEVVRGWDLLSSDTDNVAGSGDFGYGDDIATTVKTATGEYPIFVGCGIVNKLGNIINGTPSVLRRSKPGTAYVVSDEGAKRYARQAQVSLESAGVPAHLFVMPSGEKNKSMEMANRLYTWLAGLKAERTHLVVAVGGGVVGDLAGFVAATYLRGLRLCQIPTTLLSMMDSSIGGKTGVDLREGKNLVGAFKQPEFVLTDVDMLKTLPRRELASGWAEAIKHGLITDESLFSIFERQSVAIMGLDTTLTDEVIKRSVRVKAGIVSRDERETLGLRILLNYGHTIGHAIESATSYEKYLHGEAVSIGMMGAALISKEMGLLSSEEVQRLQGVLENYDLPVKFEKLECDDILSAMTLDKKISDRAVRWVLLDGIGKAVVRTDVPHHTVRKVLENLRVD